MKSNKLIGAFATLHPALKLRDRMNRAAALDGRESIIGVVERRGAAKPWRVVEIPSASLC